MIIILAYLMIAVATAPAWALCTFSLTPDSTVLEAAGGVLSVSVSTQSGCSWNTSADPSWITAQQPAGNGPATVQFTVAANPLPAARTAILTIAGQQMRTVQKPAGMTQIFRDVPTAHPYAAQIALLREDGITGGCTADPPEYCPDASTTRGQMAVFIVRATQGGDFFPFPVTPYFEDVPASHPYFKYIQKMRELGITQGCSESPPRYCPDTPVTRGQMAAFVVRARFGGDASPSLTPYFSDVPQNHPFFAFIQMMREAGITGGCTATQYCPDSLTTRGQMAVFLTRAFHETAPHALTASPPLARVGVAAQVTFTTRIEPAAELDRQTVALVEFSASGQRMASLGLMNDDGVNGDEQARDSVFTLRTEILETSPVTRYFRALASYGYTSGTSSITAVRAAPPAFTAAIDPASLVREEPGGALFPVNQLSFAAVPGTSKETGEALAAAAGGALVGWVPTADLFQVRFPVTTIAALNAKRDLLRANPLVRDVFRSYQRSSLTVLNDFSANVFGQQPLTSISAMDAWGRLAEPGSPICDPCDPLCRASATVKIAIIDTGVRATHQEFRDVTYASVTSDALEDNSRDDGHGTPVAAVIGGNNRLARPEPGVTHDPMQMNGVLAGTPSACRPNGSRVDYQLILAGAKAQTDWPSEREAIEKAIGDGARVINMSYGCALETARSEEAWQQSEFCKVGQEEFDTMIREYRSLFNSYPNVLFVIAAGNDNFDVKHMAPAGLQLNNPLPNVVVVGGSYNDERALFGIARCTGTNCRTYRAGSSFGSGVHIAAPAVNVYSASKQSDSLYTSSLAGTSFSAPFVAGTAGLMLAAKPGITAWQVKSGLRGDSIAFNPCERPPCATTPRLNLMKTVEDLLSTLPPVAGFVLTSGASTSREGQTLRLAAGSGASVTVSFSSAPSIARSGSIAAWQWILDGNLVSTAPNFSRPLPAGSHTVSLIVVDTNGNASTSATGRIEITGTGQGCEQSLPQPIATFLGVSGGYYPFAVLNAGAYPDSLFAPAPNLPACGANASASRTWVEVRSAGGVILGSFCTLRSSADLNYFSRQRVAGVSYPALGFSLPDGQSPPSAVSIVLNDRQCGATYVSNRVSIAPPATSSLPAPQQLAPASGAVFSVVPRTTAYRWTTVAGATQYGLEIDYGWGANNWCSESAACISYKFLAAATSFTHDFVGAQAGRWRVWAVDSQGRSSPKSAWRTFRYTQ